MDPFTAQIVQAVVGVLLTGIAVGMTTVYFKVKELHEWHSKEDEAGVKVWYARNKDMESTLGKMTEILDRLDRREERALLIQNETIKVMREHTQAIAKLVAVVEALTIITKKNGR
ncbi:MAG: hypothetical protein NWE76_01445 [Candidatus Bathyarchaeota archaeon]|nr:hypothetical protein [Candidatus Bathyarchaeota archaeon]